MSYRKILVDEMPEFAEDCPFARMTGWVYRCFLSNEVCALDEVECDYLAKNQIANEESE